MFTDTVGVAMGFTEEEVKEGFVSVRKLSSKQQVCANWEITSPFHVHYKPKGCNKVRQEKWSFFVLAGCRHPAGDMKTLLLALEASDVGLVGGFVAESVKRCPAPTPHQAAAMDAFMAAVSKAEAVRPLLDLEAPASGGGAAGRASRTATAAATTQRDQVAATLSEMARAGVIRLPGVPPARGLFGFTLQTQRNVRKWVKEQQEKKKQKEEVRRRAGGREGGQAGGQAGG